MSSPLRILYINYWSLHEPLTSSATIPYLELLDKDDRVEQIDMVTVERPSKTLVKVSLDLNKTLHIPYRPKSFSSLGMYIEMFHRLPKILIERCQEHAYDLIMAKASLAGGIAYMVSSRTRLPFIVESFEPHSDYMAECGVWLKYGPRYLFAKYLEKKQIEFARYLITVTRNQRNDMINAGVDPTRVRVIPSITELDKFKPDPEARIRVRQKLGIPTKAMVSIYVGKFGGLYFEQEAFTVFRQAFDQFDDLHLIILTPMQQNDVRRMAQLAGIPLERMYVLTVAHGDVPAYLAASDFAFSTIRPAAIKRYQCPIKNGEYWAAGLPIVMTDGVADDHILMRNGIGGVVINPDLSDLDGTFQELERLMKDPDLKEKNRDLARRFKSLDIAKQVYLEVFDL